MLSAGTHVLYEMSGAYLDMLLDQLSALSGSSAIVLEFTNVNKKLFRRCPIFQEDGH